MQQLKDTQPLSGAPKGNGKAKRVLTDEENIGYITQMLDAMDREDRDEVTRLRSLIQPPARWLRVFKHFNGADAIRKLNFDTTKADIEYGDDWLERDIGI